MSPVEIAKVDIDEMADLRVTDLILGLRLDNVEGFQPELVSARHF